MLHLLPIELRLVVLAQLTLHDIAIIQQVCVKWRDFVNDYAEYIFSAASTFHGYGQGAQEFCKRQKRIERAWTGYGHAEISFHASPVDPSTGSPIYRFKIDEKNKFIITSHLLPGIKVWDIETPTLLWHEKNAPGYANIEYSNGFLVFNNESKMEVWRHQPEFDLPPRPPIELPHEAQGSGRGVFWPYAAFTPPQETCTFRFIYPTLLCASERNLYLWDIPSTRLACTICNFQEDEDEDEWHQEIGDPIFLDFNEEYLVVCGNLGIGVYTRPTAGQAIVDASKCFILLLDGRDYLVENPADFSVARKEPSTEDEQTIKPLELEQEISASPIHIYPSSEEFCAAHLEGNSLTALLTHSRLLHIPDLSDPDPLAHLCSFQLGPTFSESQYLVKDNGRIVVATLCGIFIISLPRYSPLDPNTLLSPLRASLVHSLTSRDGLIQLTCLQISGNALWVTWRGDTSGRIWIFDGWPETLRGHGPYSQLCRVNFDPDGMKV